MAPSGMSRASTATERLMPHLPRSTGFLCLPSPHHIPPAPTLLIAELPLIYLLPVVKDQTLLEARGLPALSLAPLVPPFTVAVYLVFAASDDDGFSVTLFVVAS